MEKSDANNRLRDPSELEGTLLPDAAAAVPLVTAIPQPSTSVTAPVATQDAVQDAIPLPNYPDPTVQVGYEKNATRIGTQYGRAQAQREVEEITLGNRQVLTHITRETQQTETANRNAMLQNYREETGQVQTSSEVAVAPELSPTAPTFTKTNPVDRRPAAGYQVAEYTTQEYDITRPYETTEYKSVYDS